MNTLSKESARTLRMSAITDASDAYSTFTVSTARYPTNLEELAGNVGAAVLYVSIGLANEVGELAEVFDRAALTDVERLTRYARAWKELGDVQWYAARLCEELPELPTFQALCVRAFDTLSDPSPSEKELPLSGYDLQSGLCMHAGVILGVVKKMMRDGSTWDGEKRAQKIGELREALFCVIRTSMFFAERTGPLVGCQGGYAGLLRANSDKLQDRKDRGVLRGDGDNR